MRTSVDYDFGVMTARKAVNVNMPHVTPACLPSRTWQPYEMASGSSRDELNVEKYGISLQCKVAGWGNTVREGHSYPDQLQEVNYRLKCHS